MRLARQGFSQRHKQSFALAPSGLFDRRCPSAPSAGIVRASRQHRQSLGYKIPIFRINHRGGAILDQIPPAGEIMEGRYISACDVPEILSHFSRNADRRHI